MIHLLSSEALACMVAATFVGIYLVCAFAQFAWFTQLTRSDSLSLLVGCCAALRYVASGTPVRWPHSADAYRSRVALVTGATSGVGFGVACGLVEHGWTVFITGHSQEKLNTALAAIRARHPRGSVHGELGTMDLTDFHSVRAFAARVAAMQETYPLAVLVNAAGGLQRHLRRVHPDVVPHTDIESHETLGLEEMLVSNALGPMLLTELLLPVLDATAVRSRVTSRVVNVASSCHTFLGIRQRKKPMDLIRELHGEGVCTDGSDSSRGKVASACVTSFSTFNFVGYYGLSKLCVVWYTMALARRMSSKAFEFGKDVGPSGGGEALRIHVSCCHPGVLTTHLYRHLLPIPVLDRIVYYPSLLIGKTWDEGAYAALRCCAQETGMIQGGYYMCSGEYGPSSGVSCVSKHGADARSAFEFCEWAHRHIGPIATLSSADERATPPLEH